jgi:hypothetical protein
MQYLFESRLVVIRNEQEFRPWTTHLTFASEMVRALTILTRLRRVSGLDPIAQERDIHKPTIVEQSSPQQGDHIPA